VFEAVKYIDVDRKNSLPVADFTNRYLGTRTPVVFGDLTHRWKAYRKWNLNFFRQTLGDHDVDVYSSRILSSGGDSLKPVMKLAAEEYFDLLMHEEDDLQVRNLSVLKLVPSLADDFSYPRLGLNFKRQSPCLHIGGTGAKENMHYRSDLAESFLCNFGGKQCVLLVRPEHAKYTYEPPFSFESLPKVDYTQSGLTKNPAIANISAYYAELGHGDVLYIPSEYRYSVYYATISFGFILAASPSSPLTSIRGANNKLMIRPLNRVAQTLLGTAWNRYKVRKAVRRSKG